MQVRWHIGAAPHHPKLTYGPPHVWWAAQKQQPPWSWRGSGGRRRGLGVVGARTRDSGVDWPTTLARRAMTPTCLRPSVLTQNQRRAGCPDGWPSRAMSQDGVVSASALSSEASRPGPRQPATKTPGPAIKHRREVLTRVLCRSTATRRRVQDNPRRMTDKSLRSDVLEISASRLIVKTHSSECLTINNWSTTLLAQFLPGVPTTATASIAQPAHLIPDRALVSNVQLTMSYNPGNQGRKRRSKPAESPARNSNPSPSSPGQEISIEIRRQLGESVPDPPIDVTTTVHWIVDIALKMLESSRGFDTLAEIGLECVVLWRKTDRYPVLFRGTSLGDVKKALRIFLERLRKRFLLIVLDNLNRDSEPGAFVRGWFEQETWINAAAKQCDADRVSPSPENMMLRWDPHETGNMHLNLIVSRRPPVHRPHYAGHPPTLETR